MESSLIKQLGVNEIREEALNNYITETEDIHRIPLRSMHTCLDQRCSFVPADQHLEVSDYGFLLLDGIGERGFDVPAYYHELLQLLGFVHLRRKPCTHEFPNNHIAENDVAMG
ncbi:flagellar assembly factor FliW [Striga asiatica]|uniref:Flagellar assembly factor FliW n=1 Tax=Striga asiatica TaxID=4170 RepID=A0A5A7PZT0_STRAF|nr:flagellar assembly factor FliW [Striga asiatica]